MAETRERRQIASFLGLCKYYRDLILSFAHISEVLDSLYRRRNPSKNSSSSCSIPESCGFLIPSAPSFSKPMAVASQSEQCSNNALMTRASSTQWASSSKALTGSERNYAAYEVELYAVIRVVEDFRMFLLGRELCFCKQIMQPLAILVGKICPRLPGSNARSFASQNNTLRSNTRKVWTTSSQMSFHVCPSPAQHTSRNPLPSTKPIEK